MQPELGGCVDIDECANGRHECTRNQFCVNNEGSFSCLGKEYSLIVLLIINLYFIFMLLECDKSCSGCSGDGPDECTQCANNFELRDGLCKGEFNSWSR